MNYESPQALIEEKDLNEANGAAKPYIYTWGKSQPNRSAESLLPRQYLGQYCQTQGGRLTLLYKSQLSLLKDTKAKTRLSKQPNVTQAIGAYRCIINQKTQWIVSIEPTSERQLKNDGQRAVGLKTQVMTQAEAKQFYRTTTVTKKTDTAKKPTENKTAETKFASKDVEKVEAKPAARVIETPQQQQARLYVSARRDLNAGKNIVNACNTAQRAYNYGRLGVDSTTVYTESGMLVARCLLNMPAYANRFPNAKAQAKRILTHLSNQYNHAAAKNMLKQIK